MKPQLTVTAPGKLFLLGEYAVLDGAPAAVAAVSPGVEVRFERPNGIAGLHLVAPQIGERLELCPTALPEPAGPLRFVLAGLRQIPAAQARKILPGLRIVAQACCPRIGEKLGLGLSAAFCAAVTAGLYSLCHPNVALEQARPTVFQWALSAHRMAQGGAGSGADVAASVYGGILWYELETPHEPVIRPVHPVTWPTLVVAWTGVPADTTDWILRYRLASRVCPPAHACFLEYSASAVRDLTYALEHGKSLHHPVGCATHALRHFAQRTGFAVFRHEIEEAIAIARDLGLPAKWSGAGGGDCVFALAPDESAGNKLRAAWEDAGFPTLDVNWAREGVAYAET